MIITKNKIIMAGLIVAVIMAVLSTTGCCGCCSDLAYIFDPYSY